MERHRTKLVRICVPIAIVVLGLGVSGVASATCEEEPIETKVEVQFDAPTFKTGEELSVVATNTGTVEWVIKASEVNLDTGTWDLNLGEGCEPETVDPGKSCTRKFECTKAGTITVTLKVESTQGIPAEKTVAVKCD